jgi:hypothetical protein
MKRFISRSLPVMIALAMIAGCSTPRDNTSAGGSPTSFSSDSPSDMHGPTPRNAP